MGLATGSYQPCQPNSSSLYWYLLRRRSPCPAPPPTRHVQYQRLLVHQESLLTAPSVPHVRSARGRREEPASGQRRQGELVSVPVASSVAERSALLTRLPCLAAALSLELAKVLKTYLKTNKMPRKNQTNKRLHCLAAAHNQEQVFNTNKKEKHI